MKIVDFNKKAVRKLKAAGIKNAELDVTIMMKSVLENDEAFLLMHPEMPLTNGQLNKLNKLVKKRSNFEPIAYLVGHKEFFGHDFTVNRNVLIPRPETENLVEESLKIVKLKIKNLLKIENCKLKILDMGTGSGCIIISLILETEKQWSNGAMKQLRFFASDVNKKALRVAKRNARRLLNNRTIEQSNNVKFYHSDLFSNRLLHRKYDIIIANLPYVPFPCHPGLDPGSRQDKQHNFLDSRLRGNDSISFEPANAIFANDNGAAIIKNFLTEAKKYLNAHGIILLELDPRNADQIQNFAKANFPAATIESKKDLAGLKRYLLIASQ
ncbi:peptide chain release factor N(5)-glutamine methyltransferase [Candidatus Berkelbacteria bacterium CG10_big_fil_rev_8_21_14_0_10_43_13]|uniref:Peptide chain release factor N(5)-glutamine methyltransferase n=1 Tax=Candidatus Berkelbacteria bacterium CG10_big_fil_rev_8_21_14_0_10_43_13 TaxID=1974514 RepID=A0A2H0W7T2_9BACT|nr:MAG: peptide chain release factor N(5)-glutamine methyltransferase [Candidatus Berkelbacteria bacterium CG10_big_fil_rev_8_21_14_0_10_43_13]